MSTEAARPARHPLGGKGAALAALCLGALILNVDTTIVTVALPDLVRQTGATTTDLQWVVDAYSLTFGALVLAAGSLSDRLGRKGMLLAGIAVFGAASLAGSQAGSAAGLIGARAAMGVGAAMIYPSTLSLITRVFTGMGMLVFGVIEAPRWGWGSASTAAVIVGGIAVLAVMAVAETRSAHPMIDVSLFRNPRFTAACAAVAMALFALLGFIFLMTQYFQVVKSYSPLSTGVRLLPLAAAVVMTSIAGTRLAVRVGSKVIVSAGLALFGLAMFWRSRESRATSYAILVAQEVVLGAGLGLTQAPTAAEALGAVPVEKAGLASAVNGSARLFGGTLAAQQLRAASLPRVARGLDAAAVQAFLHGLSYGCVVAGGVAAVGLALVAVALPGRSRADLTARSG